MIICVDNCEQRSLFNALRIQKAFIVQTPITSTNFDDPSTEPQNLRLELLEHIATIQTLPTFNLLSHIITNFLSRKDNFNIQELAEVARDPVISAKLIGVANSAYYGNGEIKTVQAAIMRLGIDRSLSLINFCASNQAFDTRTCRSFESARYWYESIIFALTIKRVFMASTIITHYDAEEIYSIGLLKNIGLLLMVYCLPDKMNHIFLHESNKSVYQRQLDHFGFHHYEMGGHLLRAWALPDDFSIPVSQLCNPSFEGEHQIIVFMMRRCKELIKHNFDYENESMDKLLGLNEEKLMLIKSEFDADSEWMISLISMM